MGGGATIPEPRHPVRIPRWVLIVSGLALLAGLSAGIVLLLIRERVPAMSPGSQAPDSTVSALFDIRPVAVVAYPIRHGMRMGTLDATGDIATCLDGSPDLTVLDLARRTIFFADKGSVYSVGLDRCGGKPRLLASFSRLAGHRPGDGEGIQCVSMSPDGRNLVLSLYDDVVEGAWIASTRTLRWRFIEGSSACSWVDRYHLLAEIDRYFAIDQYAIDIRSGKRVFFQNPDAWLGSRSPDGRYIVFATDRSSKPELFMSDQLAGITRWLGDAPSAVLPSSSTSSAWNADGSRFLVSTDDGTRTYDALGLTRSEVGVSSDPYQLGWFSDRKIWAIDPELKLVDVATGFTEAIVLPGYVKTGETSDPQVIVSAERPGALMADPSLTPAIRAPHDGVLPLRVTFQRPPSWSVRRCPRCDIEGYAARWHVESQLFEEGPQVLFATTGDSVQRVTANVLHHSGATAPCDRKTMACVDFDIERATLGGTRFTRVDIYGEEGGETIYVGWVHGVTFMIRGDSSDPSQELILRTLRFGS